MHILKTKVNYHFDSDNPTKKNQYELLFKEEESAKFTRNDIPRIENRRYKIIVPYRVRYLCTLKSVSDNIINIYAMDVDLDEYIEENDPKKLVYVVSVNAGNCYLSVRAENPFNKPDQGFISALHFDGLSVALADCLHCYLFPIEEHYINSFETFIEQEHLEETVNQSRLMRY